MTKKPLTLALVVLATSLSACGFTLRGSNHHHVITPTNPSTAVVLEDNQNNPLALALNKPLAKHLQLLGIKEHSESNNTIKISNVRLHRYDLVGTLTEVRLVLMADVSYTIDKATYRTPIQVEQSYQYNEASVITLDQQGEKTKTWLYERLAERIAEQYYARINYPKKNS
ncbi:hypothetical protein LU293_07480 [Moraxella nasovis]|uniref:LPS assembly lipoprotein LptE n=1 Tax=Moraxella nasovis TaxID=2904121 RepID=UPI001F602409|nr:LPS assembly lipoprotein LptE [Moraxella nasovis]UNU72923.1 hypothetical protein LU293_07480 [Moraxella nasovis]